MTGPETVIALLRESGLTIAAAESLTGGLVCAELIDVPGASDVVRGGVVAYAPELKHTLLGVDDAYLLAHGTVDAGTAEQMAAGVRHSCGSDLGVATTGVAGPDPSEGNPAGTVYIACSDAGGTVSERLSLSGSRQQIRAATVAAALDLVGRRLAR